MAEEFNMNLVTAAMNGGEDYELLFTVPLADNEKIEKLKGVTMIGYVTKPELGAAMVTRDGGELPIRAQGWNAFADNSAAPASSAADDAVPQADSTDVEK